MRDSSSAERTYTDTDVNVEERPSKIQGPVTVDKSSQEIDGRLDFETYQVRKRMINTATGSQGGITGTKEPEATYNYSLDQLQTDERMKKNKAELNVDSNSAKEADKQAISVSIPLSDSQGSTDLQLDCTDISSKTTGHLNGENTRTVGSDIDPQNKDGISNYESQLRRMCAARRRLRTLSVPRELLDPDSVETVNSELLDRDNSNERTDAGMPALLL
ncbi:uncharacterized protein [Salminus brasiliensis]|uniref:uncharacterized protein n=1 Tax=Salminus brasiliensis TaxID=930266 RepID=UPI003B839A74